MIDSAKLIARLIVQSVTWLAIMALLLFLPAGNWRWTQAWADLAIFALGSIVFCVWLLRRDPALLAARLGPPVQRGQPIWDKVFIITFVFAWCGWHCVMALDAQRWRTSNMSPLLNAVGGALVVAGFLTTMIVFRENGLLLVPLLLAGIVPRAIFEERLLERELPGYADYMTRVRYRLIPGVW